MIVPKGTPASDSVGDPITFGNELAYWQANQDVYDYLSEAVDFDLNSREAYLITDQPLKVTPLGQISHRGNWVETLTNEIAKVRSN